MSVFINPLSDFGFKRIFGKEGRSEEFLIDFLNELFHDDPVLSNIVSIKYKNVEKSRNHEDDKAIQYDLYCETNTGHRFIVEMQRQNKRNFRDRVTYYLSRAISDQGLHTKEGESWEFDLIPVVGVFITNFVVPGLEPKLLVHGKFLDPDSGETVLDKVRCTFIQLRQFNKDASECKTGFDKWIYILKNMETLQDIPFKTKKDRIFERLAELGKVAKLNEEERIQYDRDLKWARDYNAEMKYAREMAAEEGRAEGLAEGRAEGREEGRAEEKLMTAKNLKTLGVDLETISKATGLTEEEMNSL